MINYVTGSFIRCIQLCNREPLKLLELIVREFVSYNDAPLYRDGKKGKYCLKGNNVYACIRVCRFTLSVRTCV